MAASISQTRSKTLHYKEAQLSNLPTLSLKDVLGVVFKSEVKPARRTQKVNPSDDESERIVVAFRTEHNEMTCGIVQRFLPGEPVIAMVMSDEADNYEIKTLLPPKLGKKKRAEFARNLMYFGIRGNHVILTEKPGFDSAELERHLHWLASKFSPEYAAQSSSLIIVDAIPAECRNRPLIPNQCKAAHGCCSRAIRSAESFAGWFEIFPAQYS